MPEWFSWKKLRKATKWHAHFTNDGPNKSFPVRRKLIVKKEPAVQNMVE